VLSTGDHADTDQYKNKHGTEIIEIIIVKCWQDQVKGNAKHHSYDKAANNINKLASSSTNKFAYGD
jgi:hypothetical protein